MKLLAGNSNKALAGALSAITAAVCGVILNLAIWFAIHTIFRETVPVRGYGLSFDAPLPASADVESDAVRTAIGSIWTSFMMNIPLCPPQRAVAR